MSMRQLSPYPNGTRLLAFPVGADEDDGVITLGGERHRMFFHRLALALLSRACRPIIAPFSCR